MKRIIGVPFSLIFGLVTLLVVISTYVPPAFVSEIHIHHPDSIQNAINEASEGDTIILHSGTYFENINFSGKAITLSSTEPDNPAVVDATIIDGNQLYSVVAFVNGEESNSVISGITIKNGKGNSEGSGGGIHCSFSSPTITKCIIKENSAFLGGGIQCSSSSPHIEKCIIRNNSVKSSTIHKAMTNSDGNGGGIYCSSSSPTITDCIIKENSAFSGGGIYCSSSSPTIDKCVISENSVKGIGDGLGGGISCSGSSPAITNCIIEGNLAQGKVGVGCGGGIYCNSSSPAIANCIISENRAYDGIGICFIAIGGGIACYSSSPNISNCLISSNFAKGYGGGVYCSSSSPTITNCFISANSVAAWCVDSPGNKSNGGGIHCCSLSSPIITNCTINKNSATDFFQGIGGGIYCSSSSPIITNCLILENSASDINPESDMYKSNGGGIYCIDSLPVIKNCTLSGNLAKDNGSGIYCEISSSPTVTNCIFSNDKLKEIYLDGTRAPIITYSDILGEYGGDTNLNTDPFFIDPEGGDYHLRADSPCIDTGTNEGAPAGDRDDIPRPLDGNEDDQAICDMGAYEFFARPSAPEISLSYSSSSEVTIYWDTNGATDIAGYNIYYKAGSYELPYAIKINVGGIISDKIDVGKVASYTFKGLNTSAISYFVVTSYDALRRESFYSNEVRTVKIISVSSSTPDGSYNIGDNIDITLHFSEEINLAGGKLIVYLNSGYVLEIEPFSSTTSISGIYPVQLNEFSKDLNIDLIELSDGATLKNEDGSNCSLFLPAGSNLMDNKNISIGMGLANSAWPCRGHDAQRTGQSPYNGAQTNALKWTRQIGIWVTSSPVIGSDGTIYIEGTTDNLYALNPDGSEKWRYPIGSIGISASPAIGNGGTIYVAGGDGIVYALDQNGVPEWTYQIDGQIWYSSPVIGTDGTIYIGSNDHNIYALNPDGSEKWRFKTGNWINTSPAIGQDGTIYIGSLDQVFYALNPEDGSLKWSFQAEGSVHLSSPAVGNDGTVYLGVFLGLYALNPEDGLLKWSYRISGGIDSSPAIDDEGTVYFGSTDGKVYALNPDGTLKWSYQTRDIIKSSPAIGADGTIYIGSGDGWVYALASDGSLKWSFQTGDMVDSSPAIGADGTLYIGSWDGNLYAFGGGCANNTDCLTDEYCKKIDNACEDTGKCATRPTECPDSWEPVCGCNGIPYDNPCLAALNGKNVDYSGECLEVCDGIDNNDNGQIDEGFDIGTDIKNCGYCGNICLYPHAEALCNNGNCEMGSCDQGRYDLDGDPANGCEFPRDPWPQKGRDSKHTGQSPHIAAQNGSLKWEYQTGDDIYSSPVIGADGIIYIGSYDGHIYALNPDSTLKWSFYTIDGIYSTPALGIDGTVYVGSRDGQVYAIDSNGSLKWTYQTGCWVESSPAIGDDGTIYVGSYDNKVYALNPDGALKWSFKTLNSVESSPAIGIDGMVYFGSLDHNVYALNPDGTIQWSYPTGGSIYSSPAIGADETIYIGSYDNKVYALNPDGTLKWSYPTGGAIYSTPSIGTNGTIYIGSGDGRVYAFDPEGNLKWSFHTPDWVDSSPVIGADGTIYVGSYDHNLYALNPDGRLRWKYQTGGEVNSSPAIGGDGTVYVGSSDGKIYAFAMDCADNNQCLTGNYCNKADGDCGGSGECAPRPLECPDSWEPVCGCDGLIYENSCKAILKGINIDYYGECIEVCDGIDNNGDGQIDEGFDMQSDPQNCGTCDHACSYIHAQGFCSQGKCEMSACDKGWRDLDGDLTNGCEFPDPIERGAWPLGGHDSRHTGQSPYLGAQTNTLKWTSNAGNYSIGEGNTLYVVNWGGSVLALDQDGQEKWSYQTRSEIDYSSSPAIDANEIVYIGCYDGKVHAIDHNGNPKWIFQTGDRIRTSPNIGPDGTIYIGSWDKKIYALNPDGSLKWSFKTGNRIGSSPAIDNFGVIYFGSDDSKVYALNPDGSLKWCYQTWSNVESSPAIDSNGTIYVGGSDCNLYALNQDGSLKWRRQTGGMLQSSPAISADGIIYVGCTDGKVYAFNSDGSLKWTFKTEKMIYYSSPAIGADGTIYIGSGDYNVYALNPDGSLKWKYKTGEEVNSSPAIGPDGTIYIGTCAFGSVMECMDNSQCPDGEFCSKTGRDLEGKGVCMRKPDTCPEVMEPVCGGDGMTYTNSCVAALNSIYVDYFGKCIEVCDGIDNDGDGYTDEEGAQGCTLYYKDEDGDSYGLDGDSRYLCSPNISDNYTATQGGDPDDKNPEIPADRVNILLEINAGWSMMSIPLIPDSAKLSELFPEAIVLYCYEKGTGYVRVTKEEELVVGKGYWILLDQNQIYELNGQPVQSYTLPVYEGGWAMIGGCIHPAQAFSDNCSIGVIYSYVQGVGYKRNLESEHIEPGKGYWILFNSVTDQAELTVETIK
ncbi:MAG: PQQ-binding-like beta-propeller repeat protein [bacterium]